MLNKTLLAAAVLALSTQPFASPDLGYTPPSRYSPAPSGKSRKKVAKERAKSKAAAKSRRAQRK